MNAARYKEALCWLVDLYQDDVRKSSGCPAIGHPLGVMDLVMGVGGDEDTCIAALFHDFGEDKGGEEMLQEIERRFGARVARIVRDCSDTLPNSYTEKEPWVDRKVAHIRHISHLDVDSCIVLAADTLHNTRDHTRGFLQASDNWWTNFRSNIYTDIERTNSIGAASTLWYLDTKGFVLKKRSEEVDSLPLKTIAHELEEDIWQLSQLCMPLYADYIDEAYEYMYKTYGDII